ncbi:MAG: ATPase [Lachnospiraceae bacterium]|nr:ATPase [Lachnospiraceae bacterium]
MESRREFVAGIDGGGTKTTAVCRDLQGNILCRRIFGPFNINSIGEDGIVDLFHELISFLQELGKCRALCIGAAGYSNPKITDITQKAMEEAGIDCWKLTGDHVIAHYGALSGRPGSIVIAGTGSACYARNAAGKSLRTGGWGHLIGDEGSGYALGRDALAAVAHWYDGYGEITVLTELFNSRLHLSGREEIIQYVYCGDKSRIATLAPIVDQAAAMGDPTATRIVRENAYALVHMSEAAIRKLSLESGEIALIGGVLQEGSCMCHSFLEEIHNIFPGLTCLFPENSPEIGAVNIACRMLAERNKYHE